MLVVVDLLLYAHLCCIASEIIWCVIIAIIFSYFPNLSIGTLATLYWPVVSIVDPRCSCDFILYYYGTYVFSWYLVLHYCCDSNSYATTYTRYGDTTLSLFQVFFVEIRVHWICVVLIILSCSFSMFMYNLKIIQPCSTAAFENLS